jgi:hypothetical protein
MKYNLIFGIRTGDWFRLLRLNGFRIAPRYWGRALAVTLASLLNTFHSRRENRLFGPAIARTRVDNHPLFILGHWRSGTSHLHRLMIQDRRFAFPNGYQTANPHSYLTTEKAHTQWLAGLVPARRLEDNMTLGFEVPGEDEIALSLMTPDSTYLAWSFPRNREYYNGCLTLEGLSGERLRAWKEAYRQYVQKLTYKYDRPLVLKSPPNTCRLGLLLELFPDARFVHIRRDPFEVFRSMEHLIATWTANYAILQNFPTFDTTEQILGQYRRMYEKYFAEKGLIPRGQLHEMAFEDLEKDPVGQLADLYDDLGLPDFGIVRGDVVRYCRSVADYRRNEYLPLPEELRSLIVQRWIRSFETWGYDAG